MQKGTTHRSKNFETIAANSAADLSSSCKATGRYAKASWERHLSLAGVFLLLLWCVGHEPATVVGGFLWTYSAGTEHAF